MIDKPIFSPDVIRAAEDLTSRFPFNEFDEQAFATCQVIQEVVDAACEELRSEVAYLKDAIAETERQARIACDEARRDAEANMDEFMQAELNRLNGMLDMIRAAH